MGLVYTVRTRGPVWATVHTSLWIFDKFFEYVLYPYAILSLGLVFGTTVMMFLSFLTCWGFITLYDKVGNMGLRDALGFETIKEIAEGTRKHLKIRQNGIRGSISRCIAFLYLSIWHDPMTALILMRPKDTYKMGAREWRLFLVSVALSNVSWAFIIFGGIEILTYLFPRPEDLLNENYWQALGIAWERLTSLISSGWQGVEALMRKQ